jgi:hypothetical protein
VNYQIDGGREQPLAYSRTVSPKFVTHVTYNQIIGALANGIHTIAVTTVFSTGDTVADSVTVKVGIPPTIANLTGTCFLKSGSSLPLSAETMVLAFSPPSVVIQRFSPVTFTVVAPQPSSMSLCHRQISALAGTLTLPPG